MTERRGPPPPSDPDAGTWRGRSVARRFVAPEGFVVLVGKSAEDNDVLTLELGSPNDFWLHVAADSGSHVVVRNPANLDRLPRDVLRFAASLAAGYSKAARGGRVAVHWTRCRSVRKRRGLPPGKVEIDGYETVHVAPSRGEEPQGAG